MSFDRTSAPALTQAEINRRLVAVADYYDGRPRRVLRPIRRIEDMGPATFAAMSVQDTILLPAEEALNKMGISTDGTVGGVIGALGLSYEVAHDLACECMGDTVSPHTMAMRVRDLRV